MIKIIIISLYILTYRSLSLAQEEENFCKFQEFRCKGGSVCLLSEKLCNGVEDCPEGEDERGNDQWDCTRTTLSTECGDPRKYFRCRFGGCIVKSQVCDGVSNCWGGTDEASDLCGNVKISDKSPRPRPSPTPVTSKPETPPSTLRTTTKPKIIRPTPPTKVKTTPKPITTTTTKPPKKLITTTQPLPPPISIEEEEDEESSGDSCPPIDIAEGQNVNCYHSAVAQVIDCKKKPSPNGTVAQINCAKFWIPPPTGSRSRERSCILGKWVGGSRNFRCELDCGEGGYQPVALVAGGITSKKGKWPWHVGLYESDPPGSNSFSNICGATLIAQNAIITAGHCVTIPHTNEGKNPRDLLLFLGKYYRSASKNDIHTQAIKPKKIFIHPHYNYASLDSDIAIILLQKDVEINSFVHPICLPSQEEILHVGAKGMLTGWGSIGDRVYPEELQEAELPFVSSLTCRKSHSALNSLVTQTNFCAGHKNGTSACDGDSGGGLVFSNPNENSKWLIGGIVSGGVPRSNGRGCDPNHFVAFTNVAKFRDWIDRVLDTQIEFKK